MGYWSVVLTTGTVVNLGTYGADAIAQTPGAGMPTIQNVSMDYGLGDGALFQRAVAKPRVISLVISLAGADLATYHGYRKSLINAFKPDRQADQGPVELRYTGGSTTLALFCYYDSGLELGQRAGTSETITLRFIAYDPYWYGLTNNTPSLTIQTSVANANYILQRSTSGAWSAMGTGGAGGSVLSLAQGLDGSVYAGGVFTSMGGVANTANLAKWSGSAWSSLGVVNGNVYALVVGPDGSIYASGSFTSAGGVAASRVAKWNGAAWSALGTGLTGGVSGIVRALAIGLDGALYAAGDFTTAGGVAAAAIAKWNGAAWSALGTGITGGDVRALAIGLDGALYAAGDFTTAGGVAVSRIAKWSSSAWSALGTGLDASVMCLATGPDGTLYAGGIFTTAGGNAASGIATWNGVAWSALGSGVSGGGAAVQALEFDSTGILLVGGQFTTAGGVAVPDAGASYFSGTWAPIDVNPPGTASVSAILASSSIMVLGFGSTGTATAAGVTSVTNAGMATAYPSIAIALPAAAGSASALYQLINFTTGDSIYFNYSILPGETLTLDLSPGVKSLTSSFRGNVIGAILPGSNLATWRLLPGANNISIYAAGSTTTCTLTYKNRHWSIDGSV